MPSSSSQPTAQPLPIDGGGPIDTETVRLLNTVGNSIKGLERRIKREYDLPKEANKLIRGARHHDIRQGLSRRFDSQTLGQVLFTIEKVARGGGSSTTPQASKQNVSVQSAGVGTGSAPPLSLWVAGGLALAAIGWNWSQNAEK